MSPYCDVCVVAAGLEGWLAATLLSHKGYDVILIDTREAGVWPASVPSRALSTLSQEIPGPAALLNLRSQGEFMEVVTPRVRVPLTFRNGFTEAYLRDMRWKGAELASVLEEVGRVVASAGIMNQKHPFSEDTPGGRLQPAEGRSVYMWARELASFFRVKIQQARIEEAVNWIRGTKSPPVRARRYLTDLPPSLFFREKNSIKYVHAFMGAELTDPLPSTIGREIVAGGYGTLHWAFFVLSSNRTDLKGEAFLSPGWSEQALVTDLKEIFGYYGAELQNIVTAGGVPEHEKIQNLLKNLRKRKWYFAGPLTAEEYYSCTGFLRCIK